MDVFLYLHHDDHHHHQHHQTVSSLELPRRSGRETPMTDPRVLLQLPSNKRTWQWYIPIFHRKTSSFMVHFPFAVAMFTSRVLWISSCCTLLYINNHAKNIGFQLHYLITIGTSNTYLESWLFSQNFYSSWWQLVGQFLGLVFQKTPHLTLRTRPREWLMYHPPRSIDGTFLYIFLHEDHKNQPNKCR